MQRTTWDQRREKLGGSLWFLPLITTLVALLLGFVLGQFTGTPDGPLGAVVFHGGPEEARRVLLTVATATIGVFAMVVGLTLVALQMASSRYSPRLVRSILRDRPTQFVLALFIATFAYNAAGLYTISGTTNDQEYPRLAVTVGIAMLFVCIAALVYYVDRVAHIIQLHRLLRHVALGIRRAIRQRPAGLGRYAGERPAPEPPATAVRLSADRAGYVQRVRPETIVRAAAAEGVTVELAVGIGDQIVHHSTLGWIWRPDGTPVTVTPKLRAAIDNALTVGLGRSTHGDVALSLIEMVDIAMVSLHIFDNHTVEQATAEMTIVLSRLAAVPLGDETFSDKNAVIRLIVPARDFEEYLELCCGEIRRKGAAEPVVLLSLVRLLSTVGTVASGKRRDAVYRQLKLVKKSAKHGMALPHDLDLVLAGIEDALQTIAQSAGNRLAITDVDLEEPDSPVDALVRAAARDAAAVSTPRLHGLRR